MALARTTRLVAVASIALVGFVGYLTPDAAFAAAPAPNSTTHLVLRTAQIAGGDLEAVYDTMVSAEVVSDVGRRSHGHTPTPGAGL